MSSQLGRYSPEEKNRIIRFVQEKFLSVVRAALSNTRAVSRVNEVKNQCSALPSALSLIN